MLIQIVWDRTQGRRARARIKTIVLEPLEAEPGPGEIFNATGDALMDYHEGTGPAVEIVRLETKAPPEAP